MLSIALAWLLSLVLAVDTNNVVMYSGTAFFINGDGYLGSVAHIISNTTHFQIKYNNTWVPCTLVAKDENKDVAIFRVNFKVPYYLSVNTDFPDGEPVNVYGYPQPDDLGENLKISEGQVWHSGLFSSYISTNAVTCPGNSGSPLLDTSNRVVGLLQGGYLWSRTGHYECTRSNYAIYVRDLIDLANENNVQVNSEPQESGFNAETVVLIEAW